MTNYQILQSIAQKEGIAYNPVLKETDLVRALIVSAGGTWNPIQTQATLYREWAKARGATVSAFDDPMDSLRKLVREYGGTPTYFDTKNDLLNKILAGSITPVGPVFDPDAAAFFALVEGNGGDWDLTGYGATYTEAYLKEKINDYVVASKASGNWERDSLTALMAGIPFEGLPYTLQGGTMTWYNLTTLDYLPVGSGAGVTGDGAALYCNTGLLDSSLDANDRSFGAYRTKRPITGGKWAMGVAANNDSSDDWGIVYNSNGADAVEIPSNAGTSSLFTTVYDGFAISSRRSASDSECYVNGSSVDTDINSVSTATSVNTWYLMARNLAGGANNATTATVAFAFIATGYTTPQAATKNTEVQTFMTAIDAAA